MLTNKNTIQTSDPENFATSMAKAMALPADLPAPPPEFDEKKLNRGD